MKMKWNEIIIIIWRGGLSAKLIQKHYVKTAATAMPISDPLARPSLRPLRPHYDKIKTNDWN